MNRLQRRRDRRWRRWRRRSCWRRAAARAAPRAATGRRGRSSGQTITVLVPYKIPQSVIAVVHEGDRREGQLRRHRLGRDALEAGRREHGAHLHRRRGRVRLVVHRASSPAPSGSSRSRTRSPKPLLADLASTDAAFKSRRPDLRRVLLERLPDLALQQEAVREGRASSAFPATFDRARPGGRQAQGGRRPVPALDPDGARPRAASRRGTCSRSRCGGQLFDKNFKPPFAEPGLGRLQGAAVGGATPSRRAGSRPAA